jgi:chlorophyll synthase
MLLPQVAVVGLLAWWQAPLHALAVAGLIALQGFMMRRFLADPLKQALWYSGFGVPVFVSGMMVSAFALRAATGAA